MTPRFITIEGTEGAGKSTCMSVVAEALGEAEITLLQTREPGGTELGEDVRELLLGHRHTGMSDDAELMLMFAARAEHLQQKILPALSKGSWVLCDRFTDASYAYQGDGRGIDKHRIAQLEQWVQGDLRPDFTLLMDIPVTLGLERAGKRSTPDRIEREATAFFERVRTGYLERAAAEPKRFRIIDASRPLDEVTAQIRQTIRAIIDD